MSSNETPYFFSLIPVGDRELESCRVALTKYADKEGITVASCCIYPNQLGNDRLYSYEFRSTKNPDDRRSYDWFCNSINSQIWSKRSIHVLRRAMKTKDLEFRIRPKGTPIPTGRNSPHEYTKSEQENLFLGRKGLRKKIYNYAREVCGVSLIEKNIYVSRPGCGISYVFLEGSNEEERERFKRFEMGPRNHKPEVYEALRLGMSTRKLRFMTKEEMEEIEVKDIYELGSEIYTEDESQDEGNHEDPISSRTRSRTLGQIGNGCSGHHQTRVEIEVNSSPQPTVKMEDTCSGDILVEKDEVKVKMELEDDDIPYEYDVIYVSDHSNAEDDVDDGEEFLSTRTNKREPDWEVDLERLVKKEKL